MEICTFRNLEKIVSSVGSCFVLGSMEVRSWEHVRAISPSADTCHWFKDIKEECV